MKKLKQKLKQVLEYVRGLKQKLSHDNLFDIAFGALLACVGLFFYVNTPDMDKLIIVVVPFLFSFLNEIYNSWCGQKGIMWKGIFFRIIISLIIYFIIL